MESEAQCWIFTWALASGAANGSANFAQYFILKSLRFAFKDARAMLKGLMVGHEWPWELWSRYPHCITLLNTLLPPAYVLLLPPLQAFEYSLAQPSGINFL